MIFRTWQGEITVACFALVLTVWLTGGHAVEWLGASAVLCGFAHAQIAERLREQEALKVNPSVSCHQFLGRYFLLREILWTAYFVALGAWSALVGCALFALYPMWRRAWRKMHPIIVQ